MVPSATGTYWCSGEALREGHGEARAGDERFEEWNTEGTGCAGCPDRRRVFLKLRSTNHAGCAVGTASAADAAGHAHELADIADVRRARAKAGRAVVSDRDEQDQMAGR